MNRSRMIFLRLIVVAGVFACLPLLMAQPPKIAPKAQKQPEPKLEDLYEMALKNSPDIQLAKAKIKAAEAKLSEANVELKKAQQMVLARVQQIQSEIEQLQGKIGLLKHDQEDARRQSETRKFEALGLEIKSFEAKIAGLKLELQSLVGTPFNKVTSITLLEALNRNPNIDPNELPALRTWLQKLDQPPNCRANWSRVSCSDCHTIVAPKSSRWIEKLSPKLPNAPKSEQMQIFNALQGKVELPAINERSALPQILEKIEKLSATPIRFRLINHPDLKEDFEFLLPDKETKAVAAWLQEIGDLIPQARFIVRDYGILVTLADRLPEDALTVREFMRQMERREDRTEAKPKSDPSSKSAEQKK